MGSNYIIHWIKFIVSEGLHKFGGEISGWLSPSLSNCSDRTIGYEEENNDAGIILKFVYFTNLVLLYIYASDIVICLLIIHFVKTSMVDEMHQNVHFAFYNGDKKSIIKIE